jgi:HEAT repeat protein
MRRLFVVLLAVLPGGCGDSPPTLSGGQPVSRWTKRLREGDPRQRQEAVAKLGNVGPADAAVLPALLDALRDPDAGVRRASIVALMKYGPEATEALPALDDMRRRDPDPRVRQDAGRAADALRRPP